MLFKYILVIYIRYEEKMKKKKSIYSPNIKS